MPTATVTSKGQITLPKPIRERLALGAGSRVAFREQPDGTVILEAETVDLLSLRGSLKPRVRGLSVEDMDSAVRQALGRRHGRHPR